MTERENLFRVLRGEIPAWLPQYRLGPDPYSKDTSCVDTGHVSFLMNQMEGGALRDIWGVEYDTHGAPGSLPMPAPGAFFLEDITKWRDKVKTPDMSGVDWEACAKRDLAGADRENRALEIIVSSGFFMELMNMCGFVEGLAAMYEEPEEVRAIFDFFGDFYADMTKKIIKYYKPDIISLHDDCATSSSTFVSLDMYRSLLKPAHARIAEIARDAGVWFDFHCCGKCEDYVADWVDMGVNMLNPVQTVNDTVGLKKRFGNKLTLVGCWDSSGEPSRQDASEETIRAEVRRCVDTYAPGGGFLFWGTLLSSGDEEDMKKRSLWIVDEYLKYGRGCY